MQENNDFLRSISSEYEAIHSRKSMIMGFDNFLKVVAEDPWRYTRNASSYMKDMIDWFGKKESSDNSFTDVRFKLFDQPTTRSNGIVGGEAVQYEIYANLQRFIRQGFSNKLLLLHGPNGSAKSTTVDTLAQGMQTYSENDEGAVYRFNWIFPTDKSSNPIGSESGPIGFGKDSGDNYSQEKTFAHLDETRIASKIVSEFKENPIYLLPLPFREQFLKEAISKKEGVPIEAVTLPGYLLNSGLSKKNQLIFENLLNAYAGNLEKVFRHVQIERFFYSKQYRVGVSTIEPQLRVDANEKQLTVDRNIANIPSVLQTINFYEAIGELVEANRGLLEFSDLLKRPVEAFKYLLSTIECSSVNLPSGTASLDIVFVATTNEKHLDGFKTVPDFSSFKERIELITVPYLLRIQDEVKIYEHDVSSLQKAKTVAPHALEYLCMWVVMTRLKQPDPENYPKETRQVVSKVDPFTKACIYDNRHIPKKWTSEERNTLVEVRNIMMNESRGLVVYEGRFGASPRETKAILYRAGQNPKHETLTVLTILEELRSLVRDRTVYEFLQFEPRGKYHDAASFIEMIEQDFLNVFEYEVMHAMRMVDDLEYENLLRRYIDNVVAEIKNETIWDKATNSFIPPSQAIMSEIEKILDMGKDAKEYRRSLLNRLASFKIDNPNKEVVIQEVFHDLLRSIKSHFYSEKQKKVQGVYRAMLANTPQTKGQVSDEQIAEAENTFKELESLYGYDRISAMECLKALLKNQSKQTVEEKK